MGKIGNAIGVLEISYYSNTVVVVDQALKAAEVDIVSFHRKLGGKLCHAVLAGGTSAVEAAMEAAVQAAEIVGCLLYTSYRALQRQRVSERGF